MIRPRQHARWIVAFVLLLLLALLRSAPHQRADAQTPEETLIVGGDHHYPPYEFLLDGEPAGFNVDLMRAVADVMELEIQIQLGPWAEMRQALEQGEVDVLMGMYYSQARDKAVDFTVPHTYVTPGLFVRHQTPIRSLDEALTGSILVQEDDVMHDYLRQEGGSVQIVPVPDPVDALRRLSEGQHDAALLSSRLQGQYLIEQWGIDNLRALPVDIELQEYCFAVPEGDEMLAQRLTEGLNSVKKSGQYKEIYDQWFGVYERRMAWETVRPFVWGGAALLLILGSVLAWSWYLRREVARRTVSLEQEIEQRGRIEEHLRRSEEKFRSIVQRAPVGIGVVDPQGRLVDSNQALAEMVGYSQDELLGKDFRDLTHPDDLQKEMAQIQRLWEGDAPQYRLTKRLIHKDGHVIWVDLSASFLRERSTSEASERVFAFIQEITRRKNMEEALRRRNRELLLLQEATQTLSATLDLEEVFPTVLQTMRELLEVTACSLWLLEPESRELVCREATGGGREVALGWRLAPGEGLAGWVTAHGEAVIVTDATQDARHFSGMDQETGLTLRSIISVPLQLKERTLGVIQAVDETRGRFGEKERAMLESFATSATIAIENARLYEQAQQEIAAREQAEEALRRHRDRLEDEVAKRTAKLRTLVDAMTGREVRMAELKTVIKQLRAQLIRAGLEPLADDPLLGEEGRHR